MRMRATGWAGVLAIALLSCAESTVQVIDIESDPSWTENDTRTAFGAMREPYERLLDSLMADTTEVEPDELYGLVECGETGTFELEEDGFLHWVHCEGRGWQVDGDGTVDGIAANGRGRFRRTLTNERCNWQWTGSGGRLDTC